MDGLTRMPEDVILHGPLPRGRHGLPKRLVVEAQRHRLTDALAAAVAEKGYAATSVADILGRAGISRSTFYELFEDKEACFIAAHESLVGRLLERVDVAYAAADSWPDGVRAGLSAILRFMAANPAGAQLVIVEVIAAGEEAHRRLRTASRAFVPLFDEGRRVTPRGDQLPANVSLSVVGGVARVIFEEIVAGRVERLPHLLPQLVYIATVPYLGPERALEEMQKAKRDPAAAVDGTEPTDAAEGGESADAPSDRAA